MSDVPEVTEIALCSLHSLPPIIITQHLVLPTTYPTGLDGEYTELVSNIPGFIAPGKGREVLLCVIDKASSSMSMYIRQWTQRPQFSISEIPQGARPHDGE